MAKATKTVKAKKETAKPSVTKSTERGYAGHNKGSRKEQVHQVFDQKGPDEARKRGVALGLKEGTLSSWFGAWRRAATKTTTAKKAA